MLGQVCGDCSALGKVSDRILPVLRQSMLFQPLHEPLGSEVHRTGADNEQRRHAGRTTRSLLAHGTERCARGGRASRCHEVSPVEHAALIPPLRIEGVS